MAGEPEGVARGACSLTFMALWIVNRPQPVVACSPPLRAYVAARTASPTRIGPPVRIRAVMPPWPRIAA
jgi:hypothetical protein